MFFIRLEKTVLKVVKERIKILVCSKSRVVLCRQRGFTLIELLVVLVLMGAVASLVLPDLWKSYVKAGEKSALYAFSDTLKQYQLDAFRKGVVIIVADGKKNSPVDVSRNTVALPEFPEGWSVIQFSGMQFYPSGVSSGGDLVVRSPSEIDWKVHFSPLHGEVSIANM